LNFHISYIEVCNEFSLDSSASAVQMQLLLHFSFDDLAGGLEYLLDSSDLEIGGGCPMGESLSVRRRSYFCSAACLKSIMSAAV